MLDILSSLLVEGDVNCKQLRTKLLAIWRKTQVSLPTNYELAKGVVEQNMRFFRKQLTHEELTMMQDTKIQTCSRNDRGRSSGDSF